MDILLLSAYHGGSHQAWAEGWKTHSVHSIEILSLPDQFWKWRLHGGAISLADQVQKRADHGARWDAVVVTDMVDLTTLLSLTRNILSQTPVLYYAHENQWTYPLPKDGKVGPMRRQHGERDRHYAFINFVSMLAADRVCFNSRFHRDEFLASLPAFLNHYPDQKNPAWIDRIEAKSEVLSLGVDLARFDSSRPAGRGFADVADATSPAKAADAASSEPPLVIWNQRWDYDKNPPAFFRAWTTLAERGHPFRLAVCGENHRLDPAEFHHAREVLADRVVHWGFADDELYQQLLWEADITLSTASHEFFGTSMCEAMYCETWTLLPDRLNYPDLLPVSLRERLLYGSEKELLSAATWALEQPEARQRDAHELRESAKQHNWSLRVKEYDLRVEQLRTI